MSAEGSDNVPIARRSSQPPETAPEEPDGLVPPEVLESVRAEAVLATKVPEMMEDIETKGYTIQHFHAVPAATVHHLKELTATGTSEGIDNEGEALKATPKADKDQCRRALPLTPDIPGLVALFTVLTGLVSACGPIFNTWRVLSGHWHLLFNKPPCERQVYHKDYDAVIKGSEEDKAAKKEKTRVRGKQRDRALPLEQMPLSVLFSVEDNTYWYAGKVRFHLPAGSFVIFRGDLEHAGAEYDFFSVRLHAYFDHPCISTPLRFNIKSNEKAIFYTT